MVLIIPPAGEVELREVDGSLAPFQSIVGGYIEGVQLPEGAMGYVNEEGLLKGLPFNERASALVGEVGHLAIPYGIRGALVCFGVDGEDEVDVPDGLVRRFIPA